MNNKINEYVEVLPIYYSEEGKRENTQYPWDIGRDGMHIKKSPQLCGILYIDCSACGGRELATFCLKDHSSMSIIRVYPSNRRWIHRSTP